MQPAFPVVDLGRFENSGTEEKRRSAPKFKATTK